MTRHTRPVIAIFIILLLAAFFGCDRQDISSQKEPTPAPSKAPSDTGTKPAPEGTIAEVDGDFSDLYKPVEVDVQPQVPPYDLPISPADVRNWDEVAGQLSAQARSTLRSNAFVVVPYGEYDQFQDVYNALHEDGIPPFVTADTALHLLHVRYAVALERYERMMASLGLIALSRVMQAISQEQYETLEGPLKEAARRNLAYFVLARQLLEQRDRKVPARWAEEYPDNDLSIPDPVADEVEAELKLIEEHSGTHPSPIFGCVEDYSHYVPRGHYAADPRLSRYFRAMMWYGRITMLLWGPEQKSDALVSQKVADRHTRQATLIVAALREDTTAEQERLGAPPLYAVDEKPVDIWEKLYTTTALLVGIADDLQPPDYARALRAILGTSYTWTQLASDDLLAELRQRLKDKSGPRIYGGLGAVEIPLPADSEQAEQMLSITQGMRLFGRRFVIDSYVMGRLVGDGVGNYTGTAKPFTGRPMRLLPRGLDVLGVLGSPRAGEIIHELQNDRYENYDAMVSTLSGETGDLGPDDWRRNLYMGWLDCIREYAQPRGEGYPSFMQTKTWQDRQVHGALGSWTQLKHDTILYAKQASYESAGTPGPEREPFEGYVEPVPELYAKLAAVDAMMETAISRDGQREEAHPMWDRLRELSEKELRNERLSEQDLQYLTDFADTIEGVFAAHEEKWTRSTLVADVFTDGVTGRVLEEGTGYLKVIVAACPRPDGGISLAAGPVFSYYEFTQPLSDRLTDEAWEQMLSEGDIPDSPGWAGSFISQ